MDLDEALYTRMSRRNIPITNACLSESCVHARFICRHYRGLFQDCVSELRFDTA